MSDNDETTTYDGNLTEVSRNPGETPRVSASEASRNTGVIPEVKEAKSVATFSFHRKRKDGRSVVWNVDKAWRVLERIAMGETLAKICSDRRMPSRQTVYNWRRNPYCVLEGKPFAERFAEAEADRTLTWEDDIVGAADLELLGDRGDTAKVSRARLKFDTLRYVMGKSNPDRYGSSKAQDQGDKNIRVQIVNYTETSPNQKRERVVWEPTPQLVTIQENEDAEG